jgi:hypothetical protein
MKDVFSFSRTALNRAAIVVDFMVLAVLVMSVVFKIMRGLRERKASLPLLLSCWRRRMPTSVSQCTVGSEKAKFQPSADLSSPIRLCFGHVFRGIYGFAFDLHFS